MSTKTADKAQTTVPPEQPAPQLPATVKPKEAWEAFQTDIKARADEIASQLPSNLSRDRFINAAIAAAKANPEILLATPRSLMSAITKAAQDGLLPDGREGIITVFQQKVRDSHPERKENVAQWNPMFYGIRKRARELDGIIIDAQVVFEGDEYDFELGDNPHITHKPKARTEKADAAKGVAVYAIFRHPTEGILHREWMWKHEVFDVMNQSRAKGSLMWTTFWTEGWRKTVGRRGQKSVPVSAPLERLLQRDDENFEFPKDHPRITGPAERPTPPPPPTDDEDETATPAASGDATQAPAVENEQQAAEQEAPAGEVPAAEVPANPFDELKEALKHATTAAEADEIVKARVKNFPDKEDFYEALQMGADRVTAIQRDEAEAAGQGDMLEDR